MSKFQSFFARSVKLSSLLFFFLTLQVDAQNTNNPSFIDGEVLIRLDDGQAVNTVLREMAILDGKATRLQAVRLLSQNLNVWQVKFDADAFSNQEIIRAFYNQTNVMVAQNNHYISLRDSVPNDPQYEDQWQYDNNGENGGTVGADIDAPEAWEITTGGLTATGDTIVVCIIDDGLDLEHEDFGDNRWYNWAEIPNNGIDDDNNGYVDDYLGWNAYDSNDDITGGGFFGGGHGTPVTGIVGAKGNNEIGVSGVNWNVKLMIVVGGGNEADAIAAYDYPLTQRKRYNQTNGSEGAFVVATNASWGTDYLQWEDAPIWCSFYDSLGTAGVLNAGATINSGEDVDVIGDMPTSCPSDFMISVTNLNRTGNKELEAGYGLTTIDLGAFGAETWTVAPNNSYNGFGGTSGASPHVAGAIGLLYSAPCLRLATLAKAEPEIAALLVRDAILNSVKPNPDLDGITVTGGTLNLKNALDSLLNSGCELDGCHEPFALQVQNIEGTVADLSWWGTDLASSHLVNYREAGEEIWNTFSVADTFTTLTGLTPCTSYQVEVLSDCDTSMSASSTVVSFTTDQCCFAPVNINAEINSDNAIEISWDENPDALQYYVEYRITGNEEWSLDSSSTANLQLTEIMECSVYEVRLLSNCDLNINNEYSPVTTIQTLGCGACEDLSYCNLNGENANFEWISNVTLETLNNSSANDGGYFDFSGAVDAPALLQGFEYPISLTVERSLPSDVDWIVWIDFDQDSFFEANEVVLQEENFGGDILNETILIAGDALPGIARMRVSMKFQSNNNSCGSFTYGEVEDYCVEIISTLGDDNVVSTYLSGIKAYPNPTEDQLRIDVFSQESTDAFIQLFNTTGQEMFKESVSLTEGLNNFQLRLEKMPEGVYLMRLMTVKGGMISLRLIKQ